MRRRMRVQDVVVGDRKRSLDQAKVAELAESMGRLGLLNPVTVSAAGELLAGLHRLEAARSLGWKWIDVTVTSLDELAGELVEIDENLIRNELSVLERAEHLQRRRSIHEDLHPETARPKGGRRPGNEEMASSFPDDAAARIGLTPRSVRHDLQIAEGICQEARDLLRPTPVADMKSQLLAVARMDPEVQVRVARKMADGETLEAWAAERQVRVEDAVARSSSTPSSSAAYCVHRCGVADMARRVEAGSVDLILTDPPYAKASIPLYEDLARFAVHALQPGGSLLVMVGQMYMLELAELMGRHLRYRWTLAYMKKRGGSPMLSLRTHRVQAFWRPILWLTKDSYGADGPIHPDVIEAGLPERGLHKWQQDVPGMTTIVERWTLPGDLVVDPFLGAGTVGVAAVTVGRRFVGCDVDAEAVAVTKSRLRDAERDVRSG